jgi:hypothetical protein
VPETVGSALGSVMAKVDAWMAQREEIARELRAAADRIMSGANPLPWRKGGQASVAAGGADAASGKARKRPTMSAEGRARIAEAQRKRWAAHKAAQGGTAKSAATTAKRGRKAKARGADARTS